MAFQGNNQLGNFEIFVSRSNDLRQWSAPLQITNDVDAHDCTFGQLDNGRLVTFYVSKLGKHGAGYELVYQTSDDSGRSWHSPTILTSTAVSEFAPCFFPLSGNKAMVLFSREEAPLTYKTKIMTQTLNFK